MPSARQSQVAAGLRGKLDGERDLFGGQFFGDGFDRDVNGGERDAQPASAFVGAQQHHRGGPGAGEFGEKFRLADKLMSGADDGFLVHRRGDERGEFAAQAALTALAQRSDSQVGGERGTGGQVSPATRRRDAGAPGIRADREKSSAVTIAGKFFDWQLQRERLV